MGYHTDFSGSINVAPPLSAEERDFINKFCETRRMDRKKGPYYVNGGGYAGQDRETDVRDYNRPPSGQPGLWCHWEVSEDGCEIRWDGVEKFYDSTEWMQYLIEHFLKTDCKAIGHVPCIIGGHMCNGAIKAQGEEMDDRWKMVVMDNEVRVEALE